MNDTYDYVAKLQQRIAELEAELRLNADRIPMLERELREARAARNRTGKK
jgi:hypothetical protein